jgi:hypothetical protein
MKTRVKEMEGVGSKVQGPRSYPNWIYGFVSYLFTRISDEIMRVIDVNPRLLSPLLSSISSTLSLIAAEQQQ